MLLVALRCLGKSFRGPICEGQGRFVLVDCWWCNFFVGFWNDTVSTSFPRWNLCWSVHRAPPRICFRCVSLIFYGSNRSNAISFCQNRDLTSKNYLPLSLCPRKFVWDDILQGHARWCIVISFGFFENMKMFFFFETIIVVCELHQQNWFPSQNVCANTDIESGFHWF